MREFLLARLLFAFYLSVSDLIFTVDVWLLWLVLNENEFSLPLSLQPLLLFPFLPFLLISSSLIFISSNKASDDWALLRHPSLSSSK
ncbi:8984_t:CDS:2, partial [Scutellospora calospora]